MRLRDIGEQGVIDLIRRRFPAPPENVSVGIGDDAAVVRSGGKAAVTTDLLVEGYDFIKDVHPPRLLGRKSLNVNLSDIAAMGGRPEYAVLGLALPGETEVGWVRDFLAGFRRAARDHGVVLVGGDLSQAGSIMISVTVLGRGRRFVRRNGARPGDTLFVSGTLGDAAAGLALLRKGHTLGEGRETDRILRAFLDPAPRIELGAALSEKGLAAAMIDLSDGLSVDLGHLCRASRTGAEIEAGRIPLSKALCRLSPDPVRSALHGGEDFELLFAVAPRNIPRLAGLRKRFAITPIGRIVAGKRVTLVDSDGKKTPLDPGGYEHFVPETKS